MDIKVFALVFGTVFLAELGDKTQIATVLFASDQEVSKWGVFIAASAALIVSSAIGVLAGSALSQYLDPRVLQFVAGAGFIVIGVFTLFHAWAG